MEGESLNALYYDGELLYNDTAIKDEELTPVMKMVADSGISVHVSSWDMNIHKIKGIVFATKDDRTPDLEAKLFHFLWNIKPYPDHINELSGKIPTHGPHTILAVSGDDRFVIRKKIGTHAKLLQSLEDVDVYYCQGKYGGKQFENMGISFGLDSFENLRRALLVVKSFNGGIYEEVLDHKLGRFNLDSFDPFSPIDINWLIKALIIFRRELIDVRIPRELYAVMKSLRREEGQ